MRTIKNKLRIAIIAIALLLPANYMFAQGHRQGGPNHAKGFLKEEPLDMIPDLSDQQKEQISQLRAEHMEKAQVLHADMDVLRAELKRLSLGQNPDQKKVNSKIDEIVSVQGKLMKEKFSHRQSIRSLLTAEQRVAFDACPGNRFEDGKRGPGDRMQGLAKPKGECPRPDKDNG